MGISILELVLRRLREEGFAADAAYPGQKFPAVTGPVAAVHIEQVDRADRGVTLEVNVVCPAVMGGARCELEALRATEILRDIGAVCVQQGCTYDGVSQVYSVAVLAAFTAVTEADSYRLGPGFAVYLNDLRYPYVTAFSVRQDRGVLAVYEAGASAPVGISRNPGLWLVEMEELIPAGDGESGDPGEDFEVKIVSDGKTELYSPCSWTEIRREYSRGGLHQIRKGLALNYAEVTNE